VAEVQEVPLVAGLQDRRQQVFLRREVVMQRRVVDAGIGRDDPQPEAFKPSFGDAPVGRLDQCLPAITRALVPARRVVCASHAILHQLVG